jgi:hypothetical protein
VHAQQIRTKLLWDSTIFAILPLIFSNNSYVFLYLSDHREHQHCSNALTTAPTEMRIKLNIDGFCAKSNLVRHLQPRATSFDASINFVAYALHDAFRSLQLDVCRRIVFKRRFHIVSIET